jgi:hypothetical protein
MHFLSIVPEEPLFYVGGLPQIRLMVLWFLIGKTEKKRASCIHSLNSTFVRSELVRLMKKWMGGCYFPIELILLS